MSTRKADKLLLVAKIYRFEKIFDYSPLTGVLVPKFDVVINDAFLQKGMPISYNPYAQSGLYTSDGSYTGGVNLIKEAHRRIIGTWDNSKNLLRIEGFS